MIRTKYFNLYLYVQGLEEDPGEFMTWFKSHYSWKLKQLMDLVVKGAWDPEYQDTEEIANKIEQWAADIRQFTKNPYNSNYKTGLFALAYNLETLARESKEKPSTIINMQGNSYVQRTGPYREPGNYNISTKVTRPLC